MFIADLEYKVWSKNPWTRFHKSYKKSMWPLQCPHTTPPRQVINKLEEIPRVIKELNLDLSYGKSLESNWFRRLCLCSGHEYSGAIMRTFLDLEERVSVIMEEHDFHECVCNGRFPSLPQSS